jgi:TonB family protein
MPRLRVRLELNQRSAAVPLDKLANVVEETRKFFHLLAEDVQIEAERGQWMASDFDTESLNFTAEYSGAVTAEQVHAFGAAFAGATSLRRATIAQFTRIADFLGEDELVGFGLYQADAETEPSEWRCLSKRDAQRFGQEIQLLAQAAGESQPATALAAVMNGSVAGRRLFKDRREREALAADPSRLIRELESNLSRRIGLLEGEVAEQTRRLKETREVGPTPDAADERFKQLLSAMETFWAQAPRQVPLLAASALAAPAPVEAHANPAKKPKRRWIVGLAMAAAAVALSFAIPRLQSELPRYLILGTMPVRLPKAPAAPAPPVAKAWDQKSEEPIPAKPKPAKPPRRFEGPQIALEIPANVRAKVPAVARVQVIVAIDDQGNVTNAEVASMIGQGARLLTKEALQAAWRSRFRPAREGERAVESQMVLTYLFKPESADF